MKIIKTYLPLKRPSAGPFFKSTLAEICFTIYNKTETNNCLDFDKTERPIN